MLKLEVYCRPCTNYDEGYVFTGVYLSTGGTSCPWSFPGGIPIRSVAEEVPKQDRGIPEQDSGYCPPDKLCCRPYASCGHVGGFSC